MTHFSIELRQTAYATIIPFRVGVQQRVFPAYRAPFFDALARSCAGGLSVFAGEPMAWEALGKAGELHYAQHGPAPKICTWAGAHCCWSGSVGLKDWLERWHPDVLIMEANPRNASTNAAVRWMHSRGRPVIGWGLGAPPLRRVLPGPLPGLFLESRTRFLSQFDALISYSRTGVEQFTAAGFPRRAGVSRAQCCHPQPTAAAARPPGVLRRGQPGRALCGPLAGPQACRCPAARLRRLPEGIRPRLMIVGDGPERQPLEALAAEIYPLRRIPR